MSADRPWLQDGAVRAARDAAQQLVYINSRGIGYDKVGASLDTLVETAWRARDADVVAARLEGIRIAAEHLDWRGQLVAARLVLDLLAPPSPERSETE